MKIYKKEVKEVKYVSGIVCDKCNHVIIDRMELEEMLNIDFTGGYASSFGDGVKVQCDICHQCLFEMISDICNYEEH